MSDSPERGLSPDGPEPSGWLGIVETFGPTIQGEGPNVGRAAHFLRLSGCNLSCSWCDTAFSWDLTRLDPDRPPHSRRLIDVLGSLEPRCAEPDAPSPLVTHLVVTGGEPLLQARELVALMTQLRTLGWSTEVETSGTISPALLAGLVDSFNVSPKLENSGLAHRARIRPQVLHEFVALPGAAFKFVVETASDLDEVAELTADLNIAAGRVYIMAQGVSGNEVLDRSRLLTDDVVARGWALTPRWHTLLWDDARGR